MRILIIVGLLLANTSLHAAGNDKDSSPKLKFKNGPVCMCARGLSEKDIMQSGRTQQVSNKNSSAQRSQQLETSQKRDSEEK